MFLDVLNTGLGISLHLDLVEYTRLGLNWNTLQVDLPSPGYQCVFSSTMDHLLRPLMVFERPRLPINWTRQETWTPHGWCESSLALNSKVLTPRQSLKTGLDLPVEDL